MFSPRVKRQGCGDNQSSLYRFKAKKQEQLCPRFPPPGPPTLYEVHRDIKIYFTRTACQAFNMRDTNLFWISLLNEVTTNAKQTMWVLRAFREHKEYALVDTSEHSLTFCSVCLLFEFLWIEIRNAGGMENGRVTVSILLTSSRLKHAFKVRKWTSIRSSKLYKLNEYQSWFWRRSSWNNDKIYSVSSLFSVLKGFCIMLLFAPHYKQITLRVLLSA